MWWADTHGKGLDPEHPDAIRRVGTIVSVHRHPADPHQIVAYLVECRGGVSGSYIVTVRPDRNHRLTLAA